MDKKENLVEILKDLCVLLNVDRPNFGELDFHFQNGRIVNVIRKDTIRV